MHHPKSSMEGGKAFARRGGEAPPDDSAAARAVACSAKAKGSSPAHINKEASQELAVTWSAPDSLRRTMASAVASVVLEGVL